MSATEVEAEVEAYEVRMDGYSERLIAENGEDALEEAKDWVRGGDWDLSGGTLFLRAYVHELPSGDRIDHVDVTIQPPEPACDDGHEHDWQAPFEIVGGIKENPGVRGNGGGVMIHEVCLHCGTERVTDTWAQNPNTGEQGLTSVSYEEDKYRREVEDLRAALAR